MSGPFQTWYSAAQLDACGQRSAVLRETLELSRLTRLRELLATDAGRVAASLALAPRSGGGWLPATLAFETRLTLTCQRCLEPLELELDERVELGVVESEALEACLPGDRVAVVLGDERLKPAELLEDELIVALPLVARHADAADCGDLVAGAAPN